MDNRKLSAALYIAAGGFFLISGLLSGKIIYIPLAACLILLGARKGKHTPEEDT